MSDYYKRDFRRRGDFSGGKEYPRGRGTSGRDKEQQKQKSSGEKSQQPTILIKPRDNTESSPCPTTIASPSVRKESEPGALYQIQTKTPSVETPTVPLMTSPVPLLSADLCSLDVACLPHLSEQSDFLVVGCLGCQGVGKSTIMSLLAQPHLDPNDENLIFPPQTLESLSTNTFETSGIDVYVTKNRIVLLDCQATLPVDLQSSSNTESNPEMLSLELAAFLFSVCHVVLFVQDYFLNPDLIRFLQTAEMLKPSTSTTIGETVVEYFPHLVFVHNMAESWELEARRVKQIQETYVKAFAHSRLQIQTGFGIANGDVSPVLDSSSCGDLVNVFLLPKISSDDDVYTGHLCFQDLFRHLRSQILSTPRTPISHTPLTEKNWFHYAGKVWEGIKKSSFFNEYHRLISNI